jgi:hypothetical protein
VSTNSGISWSGVALRFVFALVLVYGTFNPSGYSYYHWVFRPLFSTPTGFLSTLSPLKALVGVILLIGWVVYAQATRRSIGVTGGLLVLALSAIVMWFLIDWHVVSTRNTGVIVHFSLLVVSALLAVGMSWSIIRRRMSGQVDTDVVG